jgi:deoxyribodipyrimidine photo-lyase
MRTLVWFRRDLRIADNKALYNAAEQSADGVIGLFVVTPEQWKEHDDANCKVKFWLDNLAELSTSLNNLNIPLLIEGCPTFEETAELVVKIAKKHKCEAVFFNREYEVNELSRDEEVSANCLDADIAVQKFHDRVLVPPRKIETQEGKFYSVFTPYRRVWNKKVKDFSEVLPAPQKQKSLDVGPSKIPNEIKSFDFSNFRDDLWPAGEDEAQNRLLCFKDRIDDYDDQRDIPSVDGTSQLSPYLAAGVISPRQCLAAAMEANGNEVDNKPGPTTWISELAWRDFYTHVLVACPRVSKHQPFKEKTESIPWRDSESDFEAWAAGQTGYPIVDAGMRQLNQTGWMHNRLRMVTAMFLTKNLLIDWRMGERYFMQQLVDGDLAANNGGWQWSASTGTDSVPYFRIFNPFSQSKRFDPDGEFIKEMCPELESVPKTSLHDPKKLTAAIEEAGSNIPN